jgi:hypothetical protein
MPETTELTVHFSYDEKSKMFFGRLDNGARFAVSPQYLQGKLRDNLFLALKTDEEKPVSFFHEKRLSPEQIEAIERFPKRNIQKYGPMLELDP